MLVQRFGYRLREDVRHTGIFRITLITAVAIRHCEEQANLDCRVASLLAMT
jgi:hypothetical protein